mmetsp:Transcript_5475/g.8057  ORF Transcript_5475/g.8057 Transcript_5475/m.8057 type:complete len:205 (-) Transcript_5475:548-1162(-)
MLLTLSPVTTHALTAFHFRIRISIVYGMLTVITFKSCRTVTSLVQQRNINIHTIEIIIDIDHFHAGTSMQTITVLNTGSRMHYSISRITCTATTIIMITPKWHMTRLTRIHRQMMLTLRTHEHSTMFLIGSRTITIIPIIIIIAASISDCTSGAIEAFGMIIRTDDESLAIAIVMLTMCTGPTILTMTPDMLLILIIIIVIIIR